MRALMVTGPDHVELADVPEPESGPGQALIAVERAGICGTDVGIVTGRIPVRYPRIIGHEMVGTVLDIDDGDRVRVGDRVLVDPSRSCGVCQACRAGRANLCPNGGLIGRDADGGFAERLVVDTRLLHVVPGSIPLERSAMLQVLGVCVHGQESFVAFPGQAAAVIGLGVTGMLMVQLLRLRGIDTVVGITRSAGKRDLAARLGATSTAAPGDALAVIEEATGGRGADVVIECVGTVSTLAQAIELAALGGTIVLYGTITASGGELPFYELYRRELTLRNPRAALPRDYDLAIDLVDRGGVRVDEMITASYPLTDGVEAIRSLLAPSEQLKVALEVS